MTSITKKNGTGIYTAEFTFRKEQDRDYFMTLAKGIVAKMEEEDQLVEQFRKQISEGRNIQPGEFIPTYSDGQ